jgi:KDO2-lipid IV(A) lauroyltransferase
MLRRNQVVGFVCDGPQREGGVEVTFFGQRAWLPGGPARFALRCGSPMVFGYVGRRPGDRTFFGGIEPLDAYTPTGDEAADMRALTQAWVVRLEDLLRQHPDQWYMFRQMWPEVDTPAPRA